MSLRLRFTLLLGGATAIAFVVAIVISLVLTNRELRQQVDDSLRVRASTSSLVLGELMERGGRAGRGRITGLSAPEVVLPWQQINFEGDIILHFSGTPRLPVSREDLAAIKEGKVFFQTVKVQGTSFRMLTVPNQLGAAQIGRDLTETNQILSNMTAQMGLFGLAGVLLTSLLGWFIAQRTTAPVTRLTHTVEEIATTGDLNVEVPVDRTDELGRLAQGFNTMLSALTRSKQQQKRLISDAGHELRTPLTSLRTNLEVLRRQPQLGEEEQQILVESALAEAEELSVLSTELVGLATDAYSDPEPPITAPLIDFISEAIDRTRRRGATQIEVTGTGWMVSARPHQIDRAVGNLLDNAKKWNSPGSPIVVTVEEGTVTVRDFGPGISEADLPHIFDRFFRSVEARTMPGSGLGLSIVSQAVQANGGTVFARNHPDGGVEIGFSLPRAE